MLYPAELRVRGSGRLAERGAHRKRRAALLPLALMGCAADDAAYPSLSPRAIEQRSDAPPAVSNAPPAPADAAQTSDFARLLAEAREGEEDFAAAYPGTEHAVRAAARSVPASEAWVAAQAALSGLDSARAPTAAALIELDRLFLAIADGAGGGIVEAEAARAEVAALYDRQIKRLQALQAQLPAG